MKEKVLMYYFFPSFTTKNLQPPPQKNNKKSLNDFANLFPRFPSILEKAIGHDKKNNFEFGFYYLPHFNDREKHCLTFN